MSDELHVQSRYQLVEALASARAEQRVELLHEVVFEVGGDLVLTFLNEAWTTILGWGAADSVGHQIVDFVHPDDAEKLEAALGLALDDPTVRGIEIRLRCADDEPVWMALSARPAPDGTIVGTLFDLTEAKRLQAHRIEVLEKLEQLVADRTSELRETNDMLSTEMERRQAVEADLRLAQKLEAVGQLAAGIAHEINTPVQFVGDSAVFLRSAFDDMLSLVQQYRAISRSGRPRAAVLAELAEAERVADIDYLTEEIPRAFERAFDGIERVASIIKGIKVFAHPDQAEMQLADINRAIQATALVARGEYKHCADLEFRLGDIPPVYCHIGSLNQAFLNVIVNAGQAIEAAKGINTRGHIVITTSCDGSDVIISVADDGVGIPDCVKGRIFDPFFTTKAAGRGSGQGLAIARAIVVDAHRGALALHDGVPSGTIAMIRLPRSCID